MKKYHKILAEYFACNHLYLGSPIQTQPNVRKLVEQPFQQTKAQLWDEVTKTVCDLEFIQAKAAAKMTYEFVKDINSALLEIPDNDKENGEEFLRKTCLKEYAKNLISYSRGDIPELKSPQCTPIWSEEKLKTEIERVKTNPARLDRIKDFKNFLGQEAANLQKYAGEFHHFAIQQAWNYSIGGPVGKAAEQGSPEAYKSLLLCRNSTRPAFNPLPKVLQTLKRHTFGYFSSLSITPDGTRAITSSSDKVCTLWDLTTGEVLNTLKGHTDFIHSISITPDGHRAISCSSDKTCILWDLSSGKMLQNLQGHTGWINSVSITPDGLYALSCSDDKTCILWDLNSGQAIKILTGHTAGVNSVAITADGKKAFTCSTDNTCILWDLDKGEVLRTHKEHTNWVNTVAITPDGHFAVSLKGIPELFQGYPSPLMVNGQFLVHQTKHALCGILLQVILFKP
jgi:hypothetical protein